MTGEPMEEVSDEMLMALADGELPAHETRRLEARIGRDPGLAERFAVFAETRALTAQAFALGPVPDRLVAAILAAPGAAAQPEDATAPTVVPFRPRPVVATGWIGAMAAALVLAVGVGGFIAGRGLAPQGADPLAMAAAALDGVATGGTAVLPGGGEARVLGSFATEAGLCRLIGVTGAAGVQRAVVCRDGAGWGVAMAAAETGGFVPASDVAVEAIDGFLDRIGAGAALTPAQEAAALGR